jgi:Putative MetA-pathway of phenol degradation
MPLPKRLALLLPLLFLKPYPLFAQLPFYTDDPVVTKQRVLHFEFFNEIDALQSAQFPNLRQNTANFKVNYGLPHNLELDLDAPFLSIYRTSGAQTSKGFGDVDLGIKWNFHKATPDSWAPALAASLYIEFPTGDSRQELGSGLTDYWLNFIIQKPFTDKTRLTGNLGILFAGNTSTGVIGIQTTRGQVYTGGLSLLHDINARLTIGGEVYGGLSDNSGLSRSQLQFMLGTQYNIRAGMTLCFGLIGGKYVASPRIGGQIGVALDFPEVLRSAHK